MIKVVSNNNHVPRSRTVELEAASWVAQIDAGPFSTTDRLALVEWIARSPAHGTELRRISGLWAGVDLIIDEVLTEYEAAQPSVLSVLKSGFLVRPASFVAVGAAMAAMISTIVFLPVAERPHVALSEQVSIYAVPKGDDLIQTLSDGSVIHLNTDTRIEVDYSDGLRRLNLIKGEAYFDVAHDPDRPFQVYAGGGRVEAVGTEFLVSLSGDDLDLIVTEGKVLFDRIVSDNLAQTTVAPVLNAAEPILVQAGFAARFDEKIAEIASVDSGVIERETAWRQGQFVFSGDTLEYVIGEISRYSETQIVISDPALRDKRVSGVFSTDQINGVISALSLTMGISTDFVREDLVYLSAAQ